MPGSRRTERPRASRGKSGLGVLCLAACLMVVITPRLSYGTTPTPPSTCSPFLSQNFDGVTAPALPAGWTTVVTGSVAPWTTSTANPGSLPNNAFTIPTTNVGTADLISPVAAVPAPGGVLRFRNLFNLQPHQSNPAIGRDGMVLEISINGGAFADIIAAGGTFVHGQYNTTISTQFMSPIAGRMAWSGMSGGGMTPQPIVSEVSLPAAAAGQNIQLRWRTASDNGIVVTGPIGTSIDDIEMVANGCPGPTPTPTPGDPCAPTITHSLSQAITPGSYSCNGGPPNFFDLGNSYWRAFNLSNFIAGQAYTVTSVSFGIERAVNQSVRFVNIILYRQTSGVFPGGTRTQIGFVSMDMPPELTGVVVGAPLQVQVPPGTTELIMEVSTSNSGNSLFFIGSNGAGQTGPSYISASACGLTNPTDLATIGFPNMHVVMNVHGFCSGGPVVTPTPTPMLSISGSTLYCANPSPGPVPNVTLTLTGSASGATLSDGSGNYTLSSLPGGGNYAVTPSKGALVPGTSGINTSDSIAIQRHFLVLGTPLSGCRLLAADANDPPNGISTTDAIAAQRFFLGLTTGIAQTGRYKFTPASISYSPLNSSQSGQNYGVLILGDAAPGFVTP